MEHHSFSDFSYAINKTSEKKGYKEILVCYIYNGVEVLRKIYIKDEPGKSSYIFEAKQIIDKEMKSGTLASYSHKFVKRKNNGGKSSKKAVLVTASIAAVLIAGMSVGMFFAGRGSVPQPEPEPEPVPPDSYSVTFFTSKYDGQDLCLFEGETVAAAGSQYSCRIYSKYDHANRKPEISFITMGGHQLPDHEYTFEDNVLNIESPVSGDIFISTYSEKVSEYKGLPVFEIREDNVAYVTDVKPESSNADVTKANITTVDIPSEYTEGDTTYPVAINEGALNGCSSLKHLSIPFIGLTNEHAPLSYDHPNSLFGSIFGSDPYSGSGSTFTYQEYHDPEKQFHQYPFAVPSSLTEVEVTGGDLIPDGAFSRCTSIKTISFSGNTATTVGESAFLGCSSLVNIVLPSTINTISANAFNSCTTLRTVDLTNVTTIKEKAFYNCIGVSTIFIPSGVIEIEEAAFSNVGGGILCQVSDFPVSGWHPNWTNAETVVLYGYNPSEDPSDITKICGDYKFLVTYDSSMGEQEGATLIEYVGKGSKDKERPIVIPDTVTDGSKTYHVRHLGSKLFMDFIYTSSFEFHTTELISIGNYCFSNCVSLTHFTEGGDVEDHLLSIGSYAFAGDKLFELNETVSRDAADQAMFPKVTKIGNYAFHDCQKMEKICLGSVETIGEYAFSSCCYNYTPEGSEEVIYDDKVSSLKEVGLPSNLKTIGEGAFGNARGLTKVTALDNEGTFTGEAFVNIPKYCFSYTKLPSIEIAPITESIGFGAFAYCTNATSINFNKATALKDIGDSAFYACVKLPTVSILNSPNLVSLGSSGFEQCTGMTSFTVTSEKLTGIPTFCFYNDSELTSVITNFTESIESPFTTIGDYAFSGCSSLTKVFNSTNYIPATITKIGKFAFRDCVSMVSITFKWVEGISFNMEVGEAIFSGWTTKYSTDAILGTETDDTAQFVQIQKGWIKDYKQYKTNETKWGWTLLDNSVDPGGFYYKREKYTCEAAVSSTKPTHLHIHLI